MNHSDKTLEQLAAELDDARSQLSQLRDVEASRLRAGNQLDEMVQIISAIVAGIPGGLLVFQFQEPWSLILLNCNPRACELFHSTVEAMRGAEFDDIWPDAVDQGLTAALVDTVETGVTFETAECRHTDGQLERLFRLRAFRMPQRRVGVYIEEAGGDPAHKRTESPQPVTMVQDRHGSEEQLLADMALLKGQLAECHRREDSFRSTQDELARKLEESEAQRSIGDERLREAAGQLEASTHRVAADFHGTVEELRNEVLLRQQEEEELHGILDSLENRLHESTIEVSEGSERLRQEIAGRTAAEDRAERLEQYRVIVESAPVGIIACDTEGRILTCNPAMLDLLSMASPNSLAETFLDEYQSLAQLGLPQAVTRCLQSDTPIVGDVPFLNSLGMQGHARLWVVRARNEAGNLAAALAFVEDISTPKRTEASRLANERMEAFRQIAGALGHRFHGLFENLKAQAQLGIAALDEARYADLVPLVDKILLGTRASGRTVRRLRQCGRTDAPSVTRQPVNVNLSELVRETVDMDALWSRPDPDGDGVDVVVTLNLGPDCFVQGVEDDLSEAVCNLLENAVDALPGGGVITVRTFVQGGTVVLEVQDTGSGIPADVLSQIFEPFWTSRHGREGLGLAVVLSIVQRHGGTVSVDSPGKQPTVFTVKLPVAQPVGRDGTEIPEAASPPDTAHHLLLLYDLDPVARIVRNTLQRLGHTIFLASTVSQALEVLERTRIDAVVCDLETVSMSYAEMTEAIHATSPDLGVPQPPVIVVANPADHPGQALFSSHRALYRVVRKPVSVVSLVSVVSEEIKRAGGAWPLAAAGFGALGVAPFGRSG